MRGSGFRGRGAIGEPGSNEQRTVSASDKRRRRGRRCPHRRPSPGESPHGLRRRSGSARVRLPHWPTCPHVAMRRDLGRVGSQSKSRVPGCGCCLPTTQHPSPATSFQAPPSRFLARDALDRHLDKCGAVHGLVGKGELLPVRVLCHDQLQTATLLGRPLRNCALP